MAYPVQAQIAVLTRSSSILPLSRAALVKDAQGWGADYILWLDADHTFPPHTLASLLFHKKPVVGVNYPRREPTEQGHAPTAFLTPEIGVCTTKEMAQAGRLQQVASMGLGICLMKTEVFDAVPKPYFLIEAGGDGEIAVGEDAYFFSKLKSAGIPAFVDHRLSWAVGHVTQTVLTNSDVKGRAANADTVRALPGAG